MYVWVLRFQKQVYDIIFLEHRFNSSLIPKRNQLLISLSHCFFFLFISLFSVLRNVYIINYKYCNVSSTLLRKNRNTDFLYYKLCIFSINIFGLLLGKRLLYCDFLNTVFSTPTLKETTTKETTTKPNPEITTPSGRITTTEPCNVPTGMVNSKVKTDRSIAGTVVLSVLPVRNFKYCHKCLLLNKKRGQNKTMKNFTSKIRTMRLSFKVNIKNTILKRNSKVSWKNKLKCNVFYQTMIAVSY